MQRCGKEKRRPQALGKHEREGWGGAVVHVPVAVVVVEFARFNDEKTEKMMGWCWKR